MSWKEYHNLSSVYGNLADGLARGLDTDIRAELEKLEQENPDLWGGIDRHANSTDLMLQLYKKAAEAEEKAIAVLDPSKQKTLGISAVRAASFWLKARDFKQTQRVCDYWIAKAQTGDFPEFAEVDLINFLEIIQSRFHLKPGDLFCPGEPIKHDKKHLFVGRKEEIYQALRDIEAGFSLVITGEKGVGKTSFAWQLMELLAEVPETCDRWLWAPDEPYRCIWLDCKAEMKTLEEVMINLLTPSCGDYTLSRNFPEIYQSKGLETEIRDLCRDYLRGLSDVGSRIQALYREVLVRVSPKPVIFLDNFDLIKDFKKLGELIKTTAEREFGRLVIVGNSKHIGKIPIVDDHYSSSRNLNEISLRGLKNEEVIELFDRLEYQRFFTVLWNQAFRGEISQVLPSHKSASGEKLFLPSEVHKYGFESLENALARIQDEEHPLSIDARDLQSHLPSNESEHSSNSPRFRQGHKQKTKSERTKLEKDHS